MATNRPRFTSPSYKNTLGRKSHTTNQTEHGEENPTFLEEHEDNSDNDLEHFEKLVSAINNFDVAFRRASLTDDVHHRQDTTISTQPLAINDTEQASDEEVAANVSIRDDPSTLVLTFRSWFLGILFTCLLSFVNQFFWYRTSPLFVGTLVPQLLAYPLGKTMAKILPSRSFKIFRWSFSLNPGPFTIKEHCIITAMANATCSTAYAVDVITTLRLFYKRSLHPVLGIIFVITSQTLGYGIAGIMRKFLVWPSAMIWPANLVNCTLFRTLHGDNDTDSKEEANKESHWTMSRLKFFFLASFFQFLWYWFPGYIFPVLSLFSWICMIKPDNIVLSQLTGVNGLGIENPQPDPTVDVPSRQSTCPEDPLFHFGGQAYSGGDFNVISFDSFSATTGDVEGRALIRNNLNLQDGYSFGYELRTGGVSAVDHSLPYSLVVGGNVINYAGGAIYPDGTQYPYPGNREDIYVGGTFVGADYLALRVTGGNCAGCLNDDFDNAQQYYTLLQTNFDAVTDSATVSVSDSGKLTLTCASASDAYSVHIDGALFSTVNEYELSALCSADAQIVFNIGGTGTVKFAGNNINHKPEKVLYNILGSGRTIQVETEVDGSILGPNNYYNQPGTGVVKGLVIVGNVVQAHQINRVTCDQPAPPVHPQEDVCPEFETQCGGLDFPLGSGVYSFRDFNVISFGSYVANTGDIEGRLAAKLDVTLGAGYSIGYELRTAGSTPDNSLPYSLVVGRDLQWTSGSLHPDGSGIPYAGDREDAFVGRTVKTGTDAGLVARVTGDCNGVDGCLDTYFNAAHTCYSGYQADLSSLSDTVVKRIEWSALILTCSDNSVGRYVVSLLPEEMAMYTYTVLENCNFHASWIINIRGDGGVAFRGDTFPALPGGIVWNVLGSGRTIDVKDTQVAGHILAPDNTLYQTGGVIVGKVVAGDVTMALQVNKQSDCPNPGQVTIPTPTTNDVPALTDVLPIAGISAATTDTLIIAANAYIVLGSNEGNPYELVLDHPVPSAIPAGSICKITTDGSKGRGSLDPVSPSAPPSSDASVMTATFALIVALLALF